MRFIAPIAAGLAVGHFGYMGTMALMLSKSAPVPVEIAAAMKDCEDAGNTAYHMPRIGMVCAFRGTSFFVSSLIQDCDDPTLFVAGGPMLFSNGDCELTEEA